MSKAHPEDDPNEEPRYLTDNQKQEYLALPVLCPVCKRGKMYAAGETDYNDFYIYRHFYCGDCHAHWTETYELKSVELDEE
jgi:hypothetical protein